MSPGCVIRHHNARIAKIFLIVDAAPDTHPALDYTSMLKLSTKSHVCPITGLRHGRGTYSRLDNRRACDWAAVAVWTNLHIIPSYVL